MYYAKLTEGRLPSIGETARLLPGEQEITKEQYDAYFRDILEMDRWARAVRDGKAALGEVPGAYTAAVSARVEAWRAEKEAEQNAPVSDRELGRMMQEVL